MWICFNDGFISIVANQNSTGKENELQIRARRRSDLRSIFPEKKILTTYESDYRYRIFCSKEEAAELMTQRIENIDYTNFKKSVQSSDLYSMYMKIWYEGLKYQYPEYEFSDMHINEKGQYVYDYEPKDNSTYASYSDYLARNP